MSRPLRLSHFHVPLRSRRSCKCLLQGHYFPNAKFKNAPYDLIRSEGESLNRMSELKPGGILLTEGATHDTVEHLRRVAKMRPDHAKSDPMRRVKLAIINGDQAAFLTKGSLDENDHFCLGDYGNEYGEYRQLAVQVR